MMVCTICEEKSVYKDLCEKHFCEHIENNVQKTIKRFSLFSKQDRILVAISGGKDSQVLLVILKKLGYNPDALLIDEGIGGYREYTIRDTQELCKKEGIELKVVSFLQEYGKTLDELLQEARNPCTVCGTLRRHSLNKYAQGYDTITTGHNLDDEAQAILMNLCSGRIEILPRLGPISGHRKHVGFVRRTKPLYLLTEKEIRLYAFLKKLQISPRECPHVPASFRAKIREWLNEYEWKNPGSKQRVIEWFLRHLPTIEHMSSSQGQIDTCPECGFPSTKGVCKACALQADLLS